MHINCHAAYLDPHQKFSEIQSQDRVELDNGNFKALENPDAAYRIFPLCSNITLVR